MAGLRITGRGTSAGICGGDYWKVSRAHLTPPPEGGALPAIAPRLAVSYLLYIAKLPSLPHLYHM